MIIMMLPLFMNNDFTGKSKAYFITSMQTYVHILFSDLYYPASVAVCL